MSANLEHRSVKGVFIAEQPYEWLLTIEVAANGYLGMSTFMRETQRPCVAPDCPLIGWHQFDISYYEHIWGAGSSGAVHRQCQQIIVNRSLSQNSDTTA